MGIVVRRVPAPVPAASMDQLVETIERGITPRTRLILIPNPVNLTGQFFPVRRICDLAHAKGIEVCVDGAQGFAHMDFRIGDLDCDYYAASLHKWLMAPIGTGLLYIKREKIAKVWPLMPTGPEVPADSIIKFMDVGTRSFAPTVAVSDAAAPVDSARHLGTRRVVEPRAWIPRPARDARRLHLARRSRRILRGDRAGGPQRARSILRKHSRGAAKSEAPSSGASPSAPRLAFYNSCFE